MVPWRALQFRARHLYMDSNMIKSLGVFLISCLCCISAWAMTAMDDSQMEGVTGQALFQMTQTVGSSSNPDQTGLTFYKLGLDGTIALNANINQLNLGCGGINGPGGCDISVNQMSISGNGCANRALNCDAVMTNPYIELAISNDSTPTNRSLAGFRFSADNMTGLLSFGQNGPNPNGLNTFSGYMTTLPITGVAYTQPTNIGGKTDPNQTVLSFWTKVSLPWYVPCIEGCGLNQATTVPSKSNGIDIPAMAAPFTTAGTVGATINGNRQTSTSVSAIATIAPISLGAGNGTLTGSSGNAQLYSKLGTCVDILVCAVTANTSGSVSGLTANISFSENLGYVHNVVVNSPFYLAFEKQAIQWPGAVAADVAQRGWWMSFADPVNLGVLNPVQQIDINPTFNQMAAIFSSYFSSSNPIPVSMNLVDVFKALFEMPVPVGVGSQTINASVNMTLANLQLDSHQNVVPNCMGGYKFC